MFFFFFFQAEDGIRDADVTGVQTCALPILLESGDRLTGVLAVLAADLPGRNRGSIQQDLRFEHERMHPVELERGRIFGLVDRVGGKLRRSLMCASMRVPRRLGRRESGGKHAAQTYGDQQDGSTVRKQVFARRLRSVETIDSPVKRFPLRRAVARRRYLAS